MEQFFKVPINDNEKNYENWIIPGMNMFLTTSFFSLTLFHYGINNSFSLATLPLPDEEKNYVII